VQVVNRQCRRADRVAAPMRRRALVTLNRCVRVDLLSDTVLPACHYMALAVRRRSVVHSDYTAGRMRPTPPSGDPGIGYDRTWFGGTALGSGPPGLWTATLLRHTGALDVGQLAALGLSPIGLEDSAIPFTNLHSSDAALACPAPSHRDRAAVERSACAILAPSAHAAQPAL
jgi:hypothetical protein